MTSVYAVLMYRGGLLEMLYVAFTQGPGGFPYILFSTVNGSTLVTVYDPALLFFGSWFLGLTNTCLRVVLPLKCIWIPYLAHIFLMLSPMPWTYGMSMCPTFGLSLGGLSSLLSLELLFACVVLLPTWVLLLLSPSWLLFVNLFCILLKAHLGYLHLTKTSLRCSSFSLRRSGVVHTVLVQWVTVPMTLYLAEGLWWLSHC